MNTPAAVLFVALCAAAFVAGFAYEKSEARKFHIGAGKVCLEAGGVPQVYQPRHVLCLVQGGAILITPKD